MTKYTIHIAGTKQSNQTIVLDLDQEPDVEAGSVFLCVTDENDDLIMGLAVDNGDIVAGHWVEDQKTGEGEWTVDRSFPDRYSGV